MHPHDFHDERLSAYLDGELAPEERAQLDADLASDPALQDELRALTDVRALLAGLPHKHAPADLLESILAQADDEVVVPLAWYRRPFGIPLEGLAVAAAALMVVWVAWPTAPMGSSEQTDARSGAAVTPAEPVEKSAPPPDQAIISRVPYRYQIDTSDPKALMALAELATAYNGELAEEALELQMEGTDSANVVVRLPSSALQNFGKALTAYGTVTASEDGSMYTGDPVEVRIDVRLVGTAKPPPKGAPEPVELSPPPGKRSSAEKKKRAEAMELEKKAADAQLKKDVEWKKSAGADSQ